MEKVRYIAPGSMESKRLQPNWANEPTFKDLNNDYTNASVSHDMFTTKLDEYRLTLAGGKKINVRKGKSIVRPLLVRKNNEWKYSQLEEPFLTTENMIQLKPSGTSDIKTQQQTSSMINYHWSVNIDKILLVGDIARALTDDGTVIVKNGWKTEHKNYIEKEMRPVYGTPEESMEIMGRMVQQGEMTVEQMHELMAAGKSMQVGEEEIEVQKSKVVKNCPSHYVCEPEHVRIDPTAKGVLQNAQFIIHDYDIDFSTLMSEKYNPETNSGFYKNLDTIDFKKDLQEHDQYDSKQVRSFIFSDKARKKVRIREYWGKWDIHGTGIVVPIVASWIGTTMVRLNKNPFPHQKLPFSATAYMPIRGQIQGEPDGALLRENQESLGKMTRAYHDVTSTRAIGQKITMEDTFSSQSEWTAFDKGNDARSSAGVDLRSAIHIVGTEPVDPSIFQVIQLQKEDAESLTGNTMHNKPMGQKNQDPGMLGSGGGNDSSERREQSILRRMSSQLFKDMVSQDIANMQAFSSPEEVVRITDEQFVTIRREDIQGQFDITIDVNTPAKDNETARTLSFILQAAGGSLDFEVKNMLLGDILRLKGRPDQAKMIESMKREPSEAETQMQQLQLQNAQFENQLLQMKIAESQGKSAVNAAVVREYDSKVTENAADVKWKEAKASESTSRSGYYDSQRDLSQAKLVNELDGVTRERELNDMEFKEANRQVTEKLKSDTVLANKTNAEAAKEQ